MLVVGRSTQVFPGASLRAHISPVSRRNSLLAEPPLASPQPVPPGVTQEDASSPPIDKDRPQLVHQRGARTSFPSLFPECLPSRWGFLR